MHLSTDFYAMVGGSSADDSPTDSNDDSDEKPAPKKGSTKTEKTETKIAPAAPKRPAKESKPEPEPEASEDESEGGDEKSSKEDDAPADDADGDDADDADDAGEWYSTGYKESESISDREAAGGSDKVWRYFLRDGEEGVVVFLDNGLDDRETWKRKANAPFNLWEHQFGVLNDDGTVTYVNETCVRGRMDRNGQPRKCWLCEKGSKRIKRVFGAGYSILSRWTPKKGEPRWNKKLLFVGKRTLKLLKRYQVKKGGLRGLKFNTFRSDKRAARVGDEWNFDEKLKEKEIADLVSADEDTSPLDYIEEFKPKKWDELEALYKGVKIAEPGKRYKKREDDEDDDKDEKDGKDERSSRRRGRDPEDDEDKPRGRRSEKDEADKPAERRRPPRDEQDEASGDADEEKPRRKNSDGEDIPF